MNPLFSLPFKPVATIKWYTSTWLRPGIYSVCILLALTIYYGLLPETDRMKELQAGWIFQVWLRNLILILLFTGGLHIYLYKFRMQNNELKFEERDLNRKSNLYKFNNQVLDNMFWTLVSGVMIWTGYEVLFYWAYANMYIPRIIPIENPVWFVLMFVLIPIWSSFHFYWTHRLLHWPPLYKLAHSLHHRNVNIGPWSGISMHPIEHIIYFSTLAIHFVVASHPLHFLFHGYFQAISPALSHSGYEGLQIGGKNRMKLGDFFHQLHHKYYKCNYGTIEMPWDRWFNSFHDGTEEAMQRIRKRKW